MKKKIITGVIIAFLLINLSVSATSLPNFPMSVWGTVKNGINSILTGSVQVYNGPTKLGEIAISSNGQYGGNTALDQKITLNEFTGSLNYKLITGGLTYNLGSTNITKMTSICPNTTGITFISDVCQYDLNLNSILPTCDPATVSDGSVDSSSCNITCNSGYNLSGISCIRSSSGGGGGYGGGTWTSWGTTTSTCLDSQLECKLIGNEYVLTKKNGVSCSGGNLAKSCIIVNNTGGYEINGDIVNGTVIENDNGDIKIVRVDGTIITLKDIKNNWAKNYIIKLILSGLANGYDDNTFRPNQFATRVEYLKMVLLSYKIDYSQVNTSSLKFNDVIKTSWEAKVIAKAVELNIVDGNNDNFNPSKYISRAEAMKILMGTGDFQFKTNQISSFIDVSGWPIKYIESANTLGIVNGQVLNGNSLFKPFDNITRAEVAKIIIRSMEFR
ncbi:MAG: S-layer homology domain-containing protein [Candidatus Gracilibacteria bacterium]|nr:S-layer homology domain-containing protein [Candidatus Gracilibacteria bacterium]